MGWFTEQIEDRKERDRIMLEDACEELNAAITGGQPRHRTYDSRRVMQNVLDEILAYFHFSGTDIPETITDFEEQLEYALHPHGILWREIRFEKDWHRNAVGVMLGRKKSDGSLVALIPNKTTGYSYMDTAAGKRVRLNKKTEGLLEAEGYCFYMGFPAKALGIPDLIRYIAKSISPVTYLMMLGMTGIITLVGMLTPRITYIIYSQVIESGSLRVLLAIATFSISVSLSSTLLGMVRSLLSGRVDTQLDLSVQAATVSRIFSLPPGFFREYSAGELAGKMSSINTLCTTLISGIFSVGITSLFSIVYVSQIFRYARALVIPSLVITLITVAHTVLVMLMQLKIKEKQMDVSAREGGMIYALISGIQKIKLSGSEKRVFSRWLKLYSELMRLTYRQPFPVKYSENIGLAISSIGQVVLYWFAVQSQVTIAEYSAFNSAYGMISGAFMSLVGIASAIAGIQPVLKIAEPIMKAEPENSERKKMVTRLSGAVELNNVSFRYNENTPYVLDNLSIKIKAGQYVAVAGRTGCGKSTLVRMLLGFEKPDRGAVYYDGRDIAGMDLKSLRRRIGTVLQDGKLFSGDIYSNITIAAPGATLEDAWEAAEKAGLAQDIRDMPMGMHTLIAEGGGGVSGGQRQRILIARAIAARPKILILDEATSALDNITQKQVSDSLGGLKCTRIVIAHRLSTIQQCDRILYLENGKIAEDGTYEELIARNGLFAELVERQRLDT
ncbi:MAG: ATP-binding cassette domain-containing protein [Lachnospiraceae bacterium]|nr:ATP-binding cassette domain-containing protein [Lachnospiraceae bacterium]